ncbi:Uncharacterised protein [Mycobacteroides abscessus]|nr:Uncharacterised protein [Mycobacteroides abscessus]
MERSDGITKAVLDTGLSGVEEHSVEFCSQQLDLTTDHVRRHGEDTFARRIDTEEFAQLRRARFQFGEHTHVGHHLEGRAAQIDGISGLTQIRGPLHHRGP